MDLPNEVAVLPSPKRRRKWLPWVLVVVLLLGAGYLASRTYAGTRLLLHATGLFLHMEQAPVRFMLPQPTGPHAIGMVELHWLDDARPDPWVDGRTRELMISIWYPAAELDGLHLAPYMGNASAGHFKTESVVPLGIPPESIDAEGVRTHAWSNAPVNGGLGPLPVILFSPGGHQPRTLGTLLVEDLVSHGYIVVTIDHTHEAMAVEFPDGRVEVSKVASGPGVLEKMIKTRLEDVRFVLEQLRNLQVRDTGLPISLATAMDFQRMGIFGHSAGGFTALEALLAEDQLDAAVNLDGSLAFQMADGAFGEVANAGLEKPFMLMGAGLSGPDRLPHTHEHAPDWQVLWNNSRGWKLDVYLPEGEHFSFTDHQTILPQLDRKLGLPQWLVQGMIGSIEPEAAIASTRAYLRAFFDQHLRQQPQTLLRQPSPLHPFVDFIGGE